MSLSFLINDSWSLISWILRERERKFAGAIQMFSPYIFFLLFFLSNYHLIIILFLSFVSSFFLHFVSLITSSNDAQSHLCCLHYTTNQFFLFVQLVVVLSRKLLMLSNKIYHGWRTRWRWEKRKKGGLHKSTSSILHYSVLFSWVFFFSLVFFLSLNCPVFVSKRFLSVNTTGISKFIS